MKKFVVIVLIFLMVPVSAMGQTMYAMCMPGDKVNIRSKPSYSGQVCGYLLCGWDVEVVDSKKARGEIWYKVQGMTEYATSWIHGGYLVDSPVTVFEEAETYKVVSDGRVAARKCVNGKVKKWLKNGQDILVYAVSYEWAYTNKGWVKTQFLEKPDSGDDILY